MGREGSSEPLLLSSEAELEEKALWLHAASQWTLIRRGEQNPCLIPNQYRTQCFTFCYPQRFKTGWFGEALPGV